MPRYDYHIFICENSRDKADPRGCCADKGSRNIRAVLKQRLKELGCHRRVRANAAGCLDACAHGPSIVIYPQGVWYGGVCEEDVEEIVQRHILRGEIVERLLMPGQEFFTENKEE